MLCFFDSTKKREGKPEHTAVAGKAIKRVCVCVCTCVIVRAAIRWIMMKVAKEKR